MRKATGIWEHIQDALRGMGQSDGSLGGILGGLGGGLLGNYLHRRQNDQPPAAPVPMPPQATGEPMMADPARTIYPSPRRPWDDTYLP